MATTNTNPFADVFKAFGEFKAPTVDYNSLFAVQRRNIEAVTAANQVAAEGVRAVSRRGAEITRSNVEQVLTAAREMMTSNSPEVNTAKQAELARNLFEASLSNMREVYELATKSSFEVFDVLNKRAAESVEEFNATAKKATKAAA